MLHVTNGDAAVPLIREVTGAEVLPWRDVLHDGPVPAAAPDALRRIRARHLAERFGREEAEILAELEARDAALLGAEEVTAWFEHDLYDQLQLLQVLTMRPDAHVAVSDTFLADTDLAALRPEKASGAQEAWQAFTGDDPRAWTQVAGDGPLRHVPAAMRRLAEELPWTTDGLTRSQRRLRAADGDFVASQRAEEAPFLGDALAALLIDAPSAWLGGVETARWRWDPARGVASPA